jgi:archaellum biogenesis ATPase FlaH
MSDIANYNDDVQELFIRFLISDADLFARSQSIIKSKYFNKRFQPTVDFLVNYAIDHAAIPSVDQVRAVGGIFSLDVLDTVTKEHQDWFLSEFEQFCRHRAIDDAIVRSAELLENRHYGDVENLIKDAVQIGLVKDLGLSYFEDPAKRLNNIRNKGGAVSTGWKRLDEKLYGGLNRGEITIFAGGSGAGKSLWLQNFALNWVLDGLNVIYISLELDEDLISLRLDAMLTNMGTRDVMRGIDDVALKIALTCKKAKPGHLQVKQMPNGINANDLRAYIREVEIQLGIRFDALIVDYLDLMMPISSKVSPSDLFVKDKFVTEELRNLASERRMLCVTASQLNRCLALDTKIISNGKEIEIKDVQVGDWLESDQGPVQVYEKLPITKQPVYRIRTKSGKDILCSGEHKFPVGNNLKTVHNGLKVGDKLRVMINNDNSNSGEQNDNNQDET